MNYFINHSSEPQMGFCIDHISETEKKNVFVTQKLSKYELTNMNWHYLYQCNYSNIPLRPSSH